MLRSVAAALAVAALVASTPASAHGDFSCSDVLIEPAPVYVYDHNSGPRWTGNGWAYLPIGEYRPRPDELPPHTNAPPPYHFCSRSFLAPILGPVLPPVLVPVLMPLLPSW